MRPHLQTLVPSLVALAVPVLLYIRGDILKVLQPPLTLYNAFSLFLYGALAVGGVWGIVRSFFDKGEANEDRSDS
ncbi:hypothetical protein Spith_1502 [Spirochaeta thermophila DSM 6578]|uniref:Uncharacterized protein n=1 Tax=Winmispira thermophila (strain ATCC 700085 / DSM 6578 / Z-1203) TaxID=869211 RepID=G0GAE6_WINT7|nr:hypothetical protein [Spirochaeta thermophila]AEJ61765.1 hypothetical protein Spith_1502 [Spirochaeta thermophila DSM 6578]